jgi:hypothetical protein
VKVTHQAEDYPTRRAELHVRGKTVISPRRSLCLTRDAWSEARKLQGNNLPGIVEVPRDFNRERLNRIDGDPNKQDEFGADITNQVLKVDYQNVVTMFVFTFDNRVNGVASLPTAQETRYLANLISAPNNDLILPPLIPELPTSQYVEFLRRFFEDLQSYRSADRAVGLIPKASGIDFQSITKLYANKGIRFFALNLKGKHPVGSYVRVNDALRFVTELEHESGEDCFLHALNVPNLRALEKIPVTPAKDMTAFQMGFDGFGSTHVRFKKFFPDMEDYDPERNLRAFNRSDYGYHKLTEPGLGTGLREEFDTDFPIDDILAARGKDKRTKTKLFNIERQGLEANQTQVSTIEGTLTDYFESKEYIREYLPKFRKLKRD